jgi:hypothetical protein
MHYHVHKVRGRWTLSRVTGGERRLDRIGTYRTKGEAFIAGRLLAGWRGLVTTKASEL